MVFVHSVIGHTARVVVVLFVTVEYYGLAVVIDGLFVIPSLLILIRSVISHQVITTCTPGMPLRLVRFCEDSFAEVLYRQLIFVVIKVDFAILEMTIRWVRG